MEINDWNIAIPLVFVLFLSFSVSYLRSLPIELLSAAAGLYTTSVLALEGPLAQHTFEEHDKYPLLVNQYVLVIVVILMVSTFLSVGLFKTFERSFSLLPQLTRENWRLWVLPILAYCASSVLSLATFLGCLSAVFENDLIAKVIYDDGVGGLHQILSMTLFPSWFGFWSYTFAALLASAVAVFFASNSEALSQDKVARKEQTVRAEQ